MFKQNDKDLNGKLSWEEFSGQGKPVVTMLSLMSLRLGTNLNKLTILSIGTKIIKYFIYGLSTSSRKNLLYTSYLI